ncbi:MAG: hypothetical protein PHF33_00305 [Candidatus Delongbacteria bacterium]|nr:hypothetical protein [Candidatus Delongbacteria bacterium]
MLTRPIEYILKRIEKGDLTSHEARELIELEIKFEMRRTMNKKRSNTNMFL